MSDPGYGGRPGAPQPASPAFGPYAPPSPPPVPTYAAGPAWTAPSAQPWAAPTGQPWGPVPAPGWQGAPPVTAKPRRSRKLIGILAAVLVVLVALAAFVLQSLPGEAYLQAQQVDRAPIPQSEREPIPTYSTAVTAEMSTGIVLITGELAEGFSSGTGIVLSESGLVLTNYHVVSGTTRLEVELADGGRSYPAELLGRNIWADVALLQLNGASGLATADIAPNPVQLGDEVIAVGNGDGGGVLLASGGSVTALDASVSLESAFGGFGYEDATGMIQSTAGAIPGYSGGPTFNKTTEVVGVTSAGQDVVSDQMVTYSIPIDKATGITDDIVAGRESSQTRIGPAGWLGVSFGTRNVAVLSAVLPGSPAATAGLTAGSTITSFAGQPINSASGFLKLAESHDPGEVIDVTWQDDQGQPREASVTLGTSPTN